ncbi:MAG TPA: rubredoxin [Candidatus Limiplasma sp.]|nr:rubredoxin [Candidatus Limiplasma sp.]HPS81367.1 rubredoxin [Candidatus Limiplasma sp.]
MKQYVCSVCGYVYDEATGIPEDGYPAGTTWDKLPDSWTCPVCGAAKREFEEQ